jgi:glucose/arabinose dehydrogenase
MKTWRQPVALALCGVLLGLGLVWYRASKAAGDVDVSVSGTTDVTLTLEPVTSGLEGPVFVTHAGDERLFIVESPGRLRIWRDGALVDQPFLDITSQVSSGGERGLLSVAFHPDYVVPEAPGYGLFWVNYTDLDGNTVIARYQVSSEDPDRADPASERPLLKIEQPYSNHNGGQLQFGPEEGLDGERYLYIGMGDGGSGGDPDNNAQRHDTLLGKMLRLAPSLDLQPVAPFYTIPPDNPNVDAPAPLDTIWAKGLRNPWRFSFDAATGDLYIADVGQSAFEEVNITPAATPGGVNYGWRLMEGQACFKPSQNCDNGMLALPEITYAHENGRCSIIGGYVYRGAQFPAFSGTYLYADYCSGEIFARLVDASMQFSIAVLYTHTERLTAFGEDVDGNLYVTDGAGYVYRIVVL